MLGLEFEKMMEPIVMDILCNYEDFKKVEASPNFRGTPFDFFGFKDGLPFIIEYKGSLKNFSYPGKTQKRRLQELLK